MIKIFMALLVLLSMSLNAITFNQALNILENHESVEALVFKVKALKQEATLKSSWGDPKFKIAAKNFPTTTLANDETPMTGVEFAISQKIPLTTKYTHIQNTFNALSLVYDYKAKDKKENLTKALWEILILKRQINESLTILRNNQKWIEKILKVSERLYATGKVSQQALFDIQIRKSEIQSDISNKSYELSQIDENLMYLIGTSHMQEQSIPWDFLKTTSTKSIDYKELSFKGKLNMKEHRLKATKLNYIPDLSISVGYTQRSNIDAIGDFVSASISMNLPLSDEKSSNYGVAMQEKLQAEKYYDDYKRLKTRDVALLSLDIKKLINEIDILTNKMMKYAINSRKITSKSYATGRSSYIELLQSELKLQKILMHKVTLEAKRDSKRVMLKYIKGESLHE